MMERRNNNNNNNDDHDSDDDDENAVVTVASSTTTSTFVLTLMELPMTARLDIWNFLGETQEEMKTLTLLSKQANTDSKHSGIAWQEQLLPVLEISPTQGGSTEQLFHSLLHHHTNNDPHHNRQTTPYRTMTVNDMHKFNKSKCGKWKFTDSSIQLDRITSLNISSLPAGTTNVIGNCYYFPYYLAAMLPNLLYLDLSNSHYQSWFNHGREIQEFTKHCPRLEKITWNNVGTNNNKDGGVIFLNGIHMQEAVNLKVIHMDDADFFVYMNQDEMSDLSGHHPETFLFHKCCHALERVSLRNARDEGDNKPITQEALIKFVRSVPTLRWFRSDLRPDNIEMLQKEHPHITFC